MTLPTGTVTFLNFDGCYTYQNRLRKLHHKWIDLTTLRGTSLYCSDQAMSAILGKLRPISHPALTFLGSGNYHYAALALMSSIKHPFTLILIDHHTDLNEGRLGSLLSCGSWVHQAIKRLSNLKKVIIIGPEPQSVLAVPPTIRREVVVLPEEQLPDQKTLLALIPTVDVYISIDKDVLDNSDAVTNWDQGNLKLSDLCHLLRMILTDKTTAGLDICGEMPIRPHQHFNNQIRNALAINESSNLQLANLYLSTEKSSHALKLPST
ncbi:MAG: arginase family protein [Sporolactobacillus sp.]